MRDDLDARLCDCKLQNLSVLRVVYARIIRRRMGHLDTYQYSMVIRDTYGPHTVRTVLYDRIRPY
jgi:hypothetical protein